MTKAGEQPESVARKTAVSDLRRAESRNIATRSDAEELDGEGWEDLPGDAPATDAEAPRLTKWDLRKIRTRKLILHAGRSVFAERGFDTPRVEDVARAAGVSRAAFYLHFGSLEDLIQAVFEREVRWQLRRYRGLTAEVLTSERRARGWLERFFASFRQERHYILINYRALSINPAFLRTIFEGHERTIRHLARRLPELRLADAAGVLDLQRVTEMQFLLGRIEQISLYSAFSAWSEGFDDALDLTARDLVRFASPPGTD